MQQGTPEITTTTSIESKLINASDLLRTLSPLASSGRVYLLGTAKVSRATASLPTLSVNGGMIRFKYAALDELSPLGLPIECCGKLI